MIKFGRLQDFIGFQKNSFDNLGNFCFGVSKISNIPQSKLFLQDFFSLYRSFGFDICLNVFSKNTDISCVFLSSYILPVHKF